MTASPKFALLQRYALAEIKRREINLLKILKKFARSSRFGLSPKTPKPGKPNRFAMLISTLKYFGPRKEFRPMAGGFDAKSGLVGAAVPKYAEPPPGKSPPGRKKLSFELLSGCRPL
jgi:hypothetical protein